MSKYEAVYFVGDNQAINRIRVDSYKTRNRGAIKRLTESESILIKRGIEAHFRARLQPYLVVLQIANFSQITHSPTFGRPFTHAMKNCEYLGKAISSALMLGGRYTPRQWS